MNLPAENLPLLAQLEAAGKAKEVPEIAQMYKAEGLEASAQPDRFLRWSEAIERFHERLVVLLNSNPSRAV